MQALYGQRVNAINSNVYFFKVVLCKGDLGRFFKRFIKCPPQPPFQKGGEFGLKLMTFG